MKGFFTVPQAEEWIVERWGKYLFTAKPGLNVVLPIGVRIREKHLMAEQELPMFLEPIEFDFTDGSSGEPIGMIAYVRIIDSYKATYGVNDWKKAVVKVLQSKVRAALTKMTEEKARQLEKNALNAIQNDARHELDEALSRWGISTEKVLFEDVKLSKRTADARSDLYEQRRKCDKAAIERRIRAERGMGTYIESQALYQGLTFEEVQAAIAKSPKLKKESREFARILTQDAMKLDAGALKEWNINVPQGTTLEGLATVLGEALARSGGSGGSRSLADGSDSSGKKKKSGGKFEGFDNIDEAEKWMDDLAEKRI